MRNKILSQSFYLLIIMAAFAILPLAASAQTFFIYDNTTGGDCVSIGVWDGATKTCLLNSDVNGNIQINSDNVTLDGSGRSLSGTGNGVYLNQRTGVTIKNINISGFLRGVYLNNSSGNNIVSANIVSGGEIGVYLLGSSGNIIENNDILNNTYAGIEIDGGVFSPQSDNIVKGNNIYDNPKYGINLENTFREQMTGNVMRGNGIAVYTEHSNENLIAGNVISGNNIGGIHIQYGGANVEQNSIYGNSDFGLYNSYDSDVVVAENNWWGDVTGPYHSGLNPDGLGDTVSDNVDFSPWLDYDPIQPPTAPTNDIKVAVILAESSDVSHNSTSITAQPCKLIPEKTYLNGYSKEYYDDLAYCVKDYYLENSYGTIDLDFTVFDNGGNWYQLATSTSDYVGKEKEFVLDAINAALNAGADLSNEDVFVVAKAGAGGGPYLGDQAFHFIEIDGSTGQITDFSKIILGEKHPVGVWAHEIGHAVGVYITSKDTGIPDTVTPDIYNMGNVEKWDLMADGAWNGGTFDIGFIFGNGTNPPYMNSFTKEFLGWLNYDIYPKSAYGEYWINSLETSELGDSIFRYNLEDNTNETTQKYYILETRNRDLKTWDSSLPEVADKHLVLYYVDTGGLPEYGYNFEQQKTWIADWTINIPSYASSSQYLSLNDGILNPLINETYRDLDNMVKFSAITDRTVNDNYEIQAKIEEITNDSFLDKFWGVVLKPSSDFKQRIKGDLVLNSPQGYHLAEQKPVSVSESDKKLQEDKKTIVIVSGTTPQNSIKDFFRDLRMTLSSFLLIPLFFLNIFLLLLNKIIARLKLEKTRKTIKILEKIIWGVIILILVTIFVLWILWYVAEEPKQEYDSGTRFVPSESFSSGRGILPDTDLHAITLDGLHVGVNYETGEYETQIAGAIYSGDNSNAPEWIFVPEGVEVSYYVSARDNQKFLEENPDIAAQMTDITDSYEIYARYIDPQTDIYTSDILAAQTINPDENMVHQITGTTTISVSQGVVDDRAPRTEISLSGTEGENNWFVSDVEISLSAQDNEGGVGVFKTEYSLDNGETWINYAEPFNIAEEVIHNLLYRSEDFVGNIEETKSLEIKIDKTAPESEIYFDKDNQMLKVKGIDNLTAEPAVEITENGEENSGHHRGKHSEQTLYTIKDDAGHTLQLTFKKLKHHGKQIKAELESLRYDEQPIIELPKTELKYEWSSNKKDQAIKELNQRIKVKDIFKIKAKYNHKKDETKIEIKTPEAKEKQTLLGLVIIKLTTQSGTLDFEF